MCFSIKVQFLRQRNKVVVIRDEREYNAIRLSEVNPPITLYLTYAFILCFCFAEFITYLHFFLKEKEKAKTNATTSSKGKEIATSSAKSVCS